MSNLGLDAVHVVHGERIRALEVQIHQVSQDLEKIDNKLDELLALRSKGAGAFWLATTLLGAGVLGFFTTIYEWAKGAGHP